MAMVLSPELLRSYVPGLASRFWSPPGPVRAPAVERFAAAVLFADISGFTPLAERLAVPPIGLDLAAGWSLSGHGGH
jgi:class 3 adenylate cyclase